MKVREWLGVPDRAEPAASVGPGGPDPRRTGPAPAGRYAPLPPWVPFPVEHLPGPMRPFVAAVAAAMRCDPTYAALPALAACAGMIGATRTVRLKGSWAEPAMIWAVVVGESGTLKTPPYRRAVAPVIALQAEHMRNGAAAAEAHRAELRAYERAKRRAKYEDPGDPPPAPVCPRVYSRDPTIEALAGLLVHSRTRFLVGRDELSGWLGSFNQYKAKGGSDLANWLELHGLGTLCVDRKTGEPKTVFVPEVGVSLCGGIQPGVLRRALTPEHFSAGVPARLLFAYPPRHPKEWTEDDIDPAAEAGYRALVRALAELEPDTDPAGEPRPLALPLAPDAKAEWVRFYGRFAAVQAVADGELAAAFSKLEGYAARLALVHHVCNTVGAGARGPVPLASVRAGIALAEWFAREAERVYQMLGECPADADTRRLVELVARLAARNEGRVSVTRLQRANQRRFRTAGDAEAALEGLVAQGLGAWAEVPAGPTGGRPSRAFVPCAEPVTAESGTEADQHEQPTEPVPPASDTEVAGEQRADPVPAVAPDEADEYPFEELL